jgi:MFS family permease
MNMPEPSGSGLDRQTWIVAGVVIVGIVMSVIDTTIVNVALDTLARELHSPFATIQWVSTGYLLSLAVVIRWRAGRPSALERSASGWCRWRCSASTRPCPDWPGQPAR